MCLEASFKNGGKIKPKSFISGAKVQAKDKNIPKRMLPKGDIDLVLARVAPGELVIPIKHVKKVESFLKTNKIKLRGMK